MSESLPDEEQEQQEAGSQDATATSPKPKIDEAAKKGRYQQQKFLYGDIFVMIHIFFSTSGHCFDEGQQSEHGEQKGHGGYQRNRARCYGAQME